MGVLESLGADRLMEDHGLRYFLEIGTGSGADVEYASTLGFEHAYSIETVHMFAVAVYGRNARNKKMTVAFGHVDDCVKGILELIPAGAPILYWLNSHQLDVRFAAPEDVIAAETKERQAAFRKATQIAEEHLRLIAAHRPVAGDVFLLGGFGGASVQAFPPAADLLGASHEFDVIGGDQPTLRARPRGH